MSSRRTAILIGAIAVGIVAVVLIWQYVRNIENSMYEESQPVSVFVAQNEIAKGTAGEAAVQDRSITEAQVPQKFKPSTAITSTDAVQKKVALFKISPGTIVVDGMFVDPSTTQISFRERLKNKNHVAISIQVDQVKGVGGFLVPGDEVNLMVFQDNSTGKEALQEALINKNVENAALQAEISKYPHDAASVIQKGGPQWVFLGKTARYLYQKVQILAVGQTQLLSPGEQANTTGSGQQSSQNNSGLITFNVPARAAQWIASGNELGFYLSLVPKDYTPTAIGPLPMMVDLLPGEDPAVLCPYADPDDLGCTKVG